jgi:hypothetical protein
MCRHAGPRLTTRRTMKEDREASFEGEARIRAPSPKGALCGGSRRATVGHPSFDPLRLATPCGTGVAGEATGCAAKRALDSVSHVGVAPVENLGEEMGVARRVPNARTAPR